MIGWWPQSNLAIQDHVLPGIDQSQWDLIIFDEAHKLSAYRYGSRGRINKTRRYMLAERLATKTKHLLLMTATPHKGDSENFQAVNVASGRQGVRFPSRCAACSERRGLPLLPAPDEGDDAPLRWQASIPTSHRNDHPPTN